MTPIWKKIGVLESSNMLKSRYLSTLNIIYIGIICIYLLKNLKHYSKTHNLIYQYFFLLKEHIINRLQKTEEGKIYAGKALPHRVKCLIFKNEFDMSLKLGVSLSKLWEIVDREAWWLQTMGSQRVGHNLATEYQFLNYLIYIFKKRLAKIS